MKNIKVFFFVLFMMLTVTGCSSPEEKAKQVVENYFEQIYIASPSTLEDELGAWLYSSDSEKSCESLQKYIDKRLENTYTEEFKNKLVGTGHLIAAPLVASDKNVNTSLSDIKLKRINEAEEDIYFDFEGNVKIDYLEDKEDEFAYIHGQIRVKKEDDEYKIHGITYYSNNLKELY